MDYSATLEEGTPQQYKMKVMSELLTQAYIAGIDLEEFIGFFAAQVQAMLASPPNYNMFGQKVRAWIMRGFYPGSPIFFKMTLTKAHQEDHGDGSYYAKVTPMRVHFVGKGGTKYDCHVILDGAKLNDDITNRMENSLLGADHDLKPILEKKVKMPRCMSPKGLKIFRFEKLKKKRKER